MSESGRYINMSGEVVSLDTAMARSIARAFDVPDHIIGIPSPWHRRLWHRLTRTGRKNVMRQTRRAGIADTETPPHE